MDVGATWVRPVRRVGALRWFLQLNKRRSARGFGGEWRGGRREHLPPSDKESVSTKDRLSQSGSGTDRRWPSRGISATRRRGELGLSFNASRH